MTWTMMNWNGADDLAMQMTDDLGMVLMTALLMVAVMVRLVM